jgi:hypothetical protein
MNGVIMMIQQVSRIHKNTWGNYKDRTDSFDDTTDLKMFATMVSNTPKLKEYLVSRTSNRPDTFRLHPYGQYGVDMALLDKDKKEIATFDIERWSEWKDDWPPHYKWIHFLGRKEKFLQDNFYMVYMNYNRTKVIIVDNDTITQYPTINKQFKAKRVMDRVKEIPMNVGRIFGRDITDREKQLFAE